MSRLHDPGRKGGHSLAAWGEFFGQAKDSFDDFSQWSPELERRCVKDVELNERLFLFLSRSLGTRSAYALRLEHATQATLNRQRDDGFPVDKEALDSLERTMSIRQGDLGVAIRCAFQPRSIKTKTQVPRNKSDGTLSRIGIPKRDYEYYLPLVEPEAEFSTLIYQEFNLGSPKQIVERMNDAGWKPIVKTKGHIKCESELRRARGKEEKSSLLVKLENYKIYGWQVCEENLNTLPSSSPPEAKDLSEYLMLTARLVKMKELEKAYDSLDGAVHGTTIGCGASTHRMAHLNPNLSNIPGVDSPYGKDIRKLFKARRNCLLVGVDAVGIQLRLLAHLIQDDEFTRQLLEGDIHSYNANALGGVERWRAKRFIYAFLLGAGISKVAEILGCSNKEAKARISLFYKNIPGLDYVKKEWMKEAWDAGYFYGLDGRKILVYLSEHKVLSSYLQGNEKIVMAEAMRRWRREADRLDINFTQHLVSHDEWQSSVQLDLGSRRITDSAYRFARVQCNALRETGEFFSLHCPLEGSIKLGRNWYETH